MMPNTLDLPHGVDVIDLDSEVARRVARAEAITADCCRQSLKLFVKKTWSLVEPQTALRWNWHLDELCYILELVTRGKIKRLIINVPPGTMKSLLVSVFWPAWEWATSPGERYLCASYGSHLSVRDNLRLRDIIRSEWYQRHFPRLKITSDQDAKERFNTSEGGWRIATSPAGAGTGEHPTRVILDDLLTAQQARSAIERARVNDWCDRTMSTRGVILDVVIVLIMQRLHREDPTAHLEAKGNYTKVVFPMRYVAPRPPDSQSGDPGYRPDPRDRRTEPGELLWPEAFPEAKVHQLELDLGPYGTAGQLQQTPSPEGGGLFKREWFKFLEVAPVVARRVRCWDTAASEQSGDWTVGARVAEHAGIVVVENVMRGQWGPASVDATMLQTARLDGVGVSVRELQEPAAAGKTVIAARTKLLAGIDHKPISVTGDKVTMAKPFRAQCEAGNVFLLRTGDAIRDAWIEPFITELCDFPVGDHDDQVDAVSNGYNAVLLEPVPGPVQQVRVGGW